MNTLIAVFQVVAIGAGATAVMDAWLAALNRIGVRTIDMALVGRWVGHVARGTFAHDAIAKAPPVQHERAIGWIAHYATGIVFAMLLAGIAGADWIASPTPLPAIAVGVATVVAPLLVVQPAMGAGVFGSKTPSPLRSCLRSLATHAVFGAGLYAAAVVVSSFLY